MIKETVLQHKAEKKRFISESKKYIIREKIPYAEKFLNENIIKVITGPSVMVQNFGNNFATCLSLSKGVW
jgi:hypothetical protein